MRLSLLTLLILVGCADFQFNLAVNSTAAVLERGAKSLNREADVALARAALPGTMKTIDSFLCAAPEQPVFLELTGQAYAQYAFGFLEDDLEAMGDSDTPERRELVARATALYDRARDIGFRMVVLSDADFVKEYGDRATRDKALKEQTVAAGRGLYWAGFAEVAAININRTDMDRVAELDAATQLLERAHELVPDYFNHGPALALAVRYAQAAPYGDPERAQKLFEEVRSATGGKFLMAEVFYARFYATAVQDRALFEATLKKVLETPASVMPEERLANELAHRRAARYLKLAEDLF